MMIMTIGIKIKINRFLLGPIDMFRMNLSAIYGPFHCRPLFCNQHKGIRCRRKEYSRPPVVDAMKRPSSTRSILIISIISAFIAFWPMMFIHVDLFGGNPAIFLFLFTVPAGIVVFIVSLWLVNKFHNKSPVE